MRVCSLNAHYLYILSEKEAKYLESAYGAAFDMYNTRSSHRAMKVTRNSCACSNRIYLVERQGSGICSQGNC